MTTSVRAPRLRLLALGALLATGAGLAALAGGPSRSALEDAFVGSGILGAGAFALLYAVLALALVPGSALTIAAGAIYGPVVGTLVAIAGALAGATAAFALVRRTAAAESVQQIQSDRVGRVQRRLREHGLPAIIALRLIPLVPFNVLNYMAGASAIRARDYVVGTAIGIVPGAIAFATLGATAHDPRSPAFIAAAAVAVVLIVAGAIVARRRPSAPARSRSRAPAARASLAPELRRLAWSAAFVLTVAGALLASGLYH